MIFSELPIGSEFNLGRVKFTKIDEEGMCAALESFVYLAYDHPRMTTGKNNYEKESGTKFFFDSSVYKYLNCSDTSWSTCETGDYEPYNSELDGFLSHFNDDELKYLTPYELSIEVPNGYIRKYGEHFKKNVLVGLPTYEFAKQIVDATGSGFGSWLCESGTMPLRFRWRSSAPYNGRNHEKMAAVVKVKSDAPVDIDEDNNFVIRVPIRDFDGNLEEFLGMM